MVDYSAQAEAPALKRGTRGFAVGLKAEVVEHLSYLAISCRLNESRFLRVGRFLWHAHLELTLNFSTHRFNVPSLIA